MPGKGGGQICLCVAFLLGKRETHKQKSQEISGQCRDNPLNTLFMCFLVLFGEGGGPNYRVAQNNYMHLSMIFEFISPKVHLHFYLIQLNNSGWSSLAEIYHYTPAFHRYTPDYTPAFHRYTPDYTCTFQMFLFYLGVYLYVGPQGTTGVRNDFPSWPRIQNGVRSESKHF